MCILKSTGEKGIFSAEGGEKFEVLKILDWFLLQFMVKFELWEKLGGSMDPTGMKSLDGGSGFGR